MALRPLITIPVLIFIIQYGCSNVLETSSTLAVYDSSRNYALPKHLKPIHYDIALEPTFDEIPEIEFTFTGKVEIQIQVVSETDQVVLNSRNLTNTVCVVYKGTGPEQIGAAYNFYEVEVEKLTIKLKEKLKIGVGYLISCTYTGTLLHGDFKGFYLSKYQEDGKTKYLGTTQFESSGARRAFPCFDEPGFKATFTLTITNDPSYKTVISNMKGKSKTVDKKRVTTFEKTPKMSTYLLAFVVSNFQSLKLKEEKAPKMTVYYRDAFKDYAERSNVFGNASIKAMEEYLDMKYTELKLDQIGIPDFASGAMENWGLVTYREVQFLFNPSEATTLNLNKIYCTITHELAHQWFGNLVTPGWWKYIWLNEGFARYFQYKVTDNAVAKLHDTDYADKPWRTYEQFIVARHSAFKDDGLKTSRPMTSQAETPHEVNNLFDTISYAKAGSVLFMMEHIVTETVWKKGLKRYLKQFSYNEVEPKNLWDAIQAEYDAEFLENPASLPKLGHLTINDIGNSWSMETGYPVVDVRKEDNKLHLKQRRFQTDFKTDALSKWIIPITYGRSFRLEEDLANTAPIDFLQTGERTITVDVTNEEFVLINNQQTGYYRVNYDTESWKKITNYLESRENAQKLPPVSLAQLVDDSLNLARGGYLSYSITLPLIKFLQHVYDYIPWEAAVTNFKFLDQQVRGSDAEDGYYAYNRQLLEKVFDEIVYGYRVGLEDDHSLKLNRLNILKRACDFGVKSCVKLAAEVLKNEYLRQPKEEPMLPDIQPALYCGGTRRGDDETHFNLLARYKTLQSANEKQNLVLGLGCFGDTEILKKIMDESMDPESVLKDHWTTIFTGMIEAGTQSLDLALNYVNKHYEHLEENLGAENMSSIIKSFGSYITRKSHLDKLTKLEGKIGDSLQGTLKTATETIQKKIDWNNEHLSEISDWLRNNKYYNSATNVAVNLVLLSSVIILSLIYC